MGQKKFFLLVFVPEIFFFFFNPTGGNPFFHELGTWGCLPEFLGSKICPKNPWFFFFSPQNAKGKKAKTNHPLPFRNWKIFFFKQNIQFAPKFFFLVIVKRDLERGCPQKNGFGKNLSSKFKFFRAKISQKPNPNLVTITGEKTKCLGARKRNPVIIRNANETPRAGRDRDESKACIRPDLRITKGAAYRSTLIILRVRYRTKE